MKYLSYVLSIIAVSCLLATCITEYSPGDLSGHDGLLVVEGVIVEGETTIMLSRSVALNSNDLLSQQGISGALVWIEGEKGERFDAVEHPDFPGEYRAAIDILDKESRYRLRISWNGEEYNSDFRTPQSTPPIKEVNFHMLDEKEGPVQVLLSVDGEPGGSRHYLWSYEETWETNAAMMATQYFSYEEGDYGRDGLGYPFSYGGTNVFDYPNHYQPVYFCWKYNNSKEILLADTELLTENTLKNRLLYEISLDNDRLSQLYHTKINLYSIAEDAYYYYTNQKKNTDETGSIFAPIPSEMQGNIVCTTSPGVPVIGFVDISKRVQHEASLDRPVGYRQPYRDCKAISLDELNGVGYSSDMLFLYQYLPSMPPQIFLATRNCLDCRTQGGTKNRPGWWPNDHY